jgi:hypothetical protein
MRRHRTRNLTRRSWDSGFAALRRPGMTTWLLVPAAHYARRFANHWPLKIEGAGKTGCALHPRSRVQKWEKKRTRAYRFSGGSPAFPAQWFYGLCRALLGDEFVIVTVVGGYGLSEPGRARKTSADLASATDARTTRFCRTLQRRSSCASFDRSRVFRQPALRSRHAPDAAASTASHPNVRDDRDTPLVEG